MSLRGLLYRLYGVLLLGIALSCYVCYVFLDGKDIYVAAVLLDEENAARQGEVSGDRL